VFLPKGKILPCITHRKSDEWIYVLSGLLVGRIDHKKYMLKAGDYLYLSPGVWHQFEAQTNVSSLAIHMPPLGKKRLDIVLCKK
jgi:quercetin dioxygenase-like cupin family protein